MRSNVFPLKEKQSVFLDSISSSSSGEIRTGRVVSVSAPESLRSEVLSRGRRFPVTSFRDDVALYHSSAIDALGLRPRPLNAIRTVDAVRSADFSGITSMKRPFTITIPALPEMPDFSEARETLRVLDRRFRDYGGNLSTGLSGFRLGLSSRHMAYAPLVGAMALGMVSALALEHAFGTDAQAEEARIVYVEKPAVGRVLGAETTDRSVFETEQLLAELATEDSDDKEFENRVRELVKGYPIEDMIPEIMKLDRQVAMYYIAIAKKESNWGKRVPVLDGQDCYNYVGYRGIRNMMGTGGHTCFNSRADAVMTVGKRLETLITQYGLDTPDKLIVWKCGSSCAGHSSYSVQKWKDDVRMYYGKLNPDDGKSDRPDA